MQRGSWLQARQIARQTPPVRLVALLLGLGWHRPQLRSARSVRGPPQQDPENDHPPEKDRDAGADPGEAVETARGRYHADLLAVLSHEAGDDVFGGLARLQLPLDAIAQLVGGAAGAVIDRLAGAAARAEGPPRAPFAT